MIPNEIGNSLEKFDATIWRINALDINIRNGIKET